MPRLQDKQILGINEQTDDYTLVLADAGLVVEMNKASANTLTIPAHGSVAFLDYAAVTVVQTGAGTTTIEWASGITVNGTDGGSLDISGQWKAVQLYQTDTPDEWRAIGSVA